MYPLRDVFSKFLEDAESEAGGFIIPAYQRGYKWTSSGDNSQIRVLMRDLFNAFNNGKNRYYLQFITLIKNESGLEVIDGQQRLTTLTILFSVLSRFEEVEGEENFVINKLTYQVRENFIDKFIYTNIDAILQSENWDDFLEANEEDSSDIDNQDVYFIYHAAKSINKFLML
ncbi:MAG: DUF262 domain-containing protein [Pedobacter sp.]|nr:MAG: DUF262 domain-containing protein [Pedobacter sp.]